jgi:hypothetical protein
MGASPTLNTLPPAGEWVERLMKPFLSPITWPKATVSPGFTTGVEGVPRCWHRETVTVSGMGILTTDLELLSSLLPGGWVPPEKVLALLIFLQRSA